MTRIFHRSDAADASIDGERIAVVGYGNQGRSWALNLRDSGCDVTVCVRNDESRAQATEEGFEAADIADANEADIICVLVPDDAIPGLGLEPRADACTVLASGYTIAYERFTPEGDVVMIAPRMLGPEVRETYVEDVGFITAVGVHHDATGRAAERMLALADALGGLKQGAIEMTMMQETILDLAVEQVLSPALTHVNTAFVTVMSELGIPLEAIMCELFMSGEVERTYTRLRLEGFAGQLEYHSPTSQYGQLSRRGRYDHLDFTDAMRELTADITSGSFADEWDAEREAGHPTLAELKDEHAGELIKAVEADIRAKLGETASVE